MVVSQLNYTINTQFIIKLKNIYVSNLKFIIPLIYLFFSYNNLNS